MTDNEIKREKTFSEELPYFKELIKEVFNNYHNPEGNEDPLHISLLRDSYRIVLKAEEEITCLKAEIEHWKEEAHKLAEVCYDLDMWLDKHNIECEIRNTHTEV